MSTHISPPTSTYPPESYYLSGAKSNSSFTWQASFLPDLSDIAVPIYLLFRHISPSSIYGALCQILSENETNEVQSESEEIWRIRGFLVNRDYLQGLPHRTIGRHSYLVLRSIQVHLEYYLWDR